MDAEFRNRKTWCRGVAQMQIARANAQYLPQSPSYTKLLTDSPRSLFYFAALSSANPLIPAPVF